MPVRRQHGLGSHARPDQVPVLEEHVVDTARRPERTTERGVATGDAEQAVVALHQGGEAPEGKARVPHLGVMDGVHVEVAGPHRDVGVAVGDMSTQASQVEIGPAPVHVVPREAGSLDELVHVGVEHLHRPAAGPVTEKHPGQEPVRESLDLPVDPGAHRPHLRRPRPIGVEGERRRAPRDRVLDPARGEELPAGPVQRGPQHREERPCLLEPDEVHAGRAGQPAHVGPHPDPSCRGHRPRVEQVEGHHAERRRRHDRPVTRGHPRWRPFRIRRARARRRAERRGPGDREQGDGHGEPSDAYAVPGHATIPR